MYDNVFQEKKKKQPPQNTHQNKTKQKKDTDIFVPLCTSRCDLQEKKTFCAKQWGIF